MNQRINDDAITQKCGRIDAACKRYNLGRATMRKIAAEAGAVIRYGRTVNYNFDKIDAFMDRNSGE